MYKINCRENMNPITTIYYDEKSGSWFAKTIDNGYIVPHSHYYNPNNRRQLFDVIDAQVNAHIGESMTDEEIDDLRGDVAHDFLNKIVNGLCSEASLSTGIYMTDFQRLGRKTQFDV